MVVSSLKSRPYAPPDALRNSNIPGNLAIRVGCPRTIQGHDGIVLMPEIWHPEAASEKQDTCSWRCRINYDQRTLVEQLMLSWEFQA
jgi:hypothetical protein